uniref:Uncharacterized protein n=1 Tax=Anopheles stephensi TaxID=30069 RepID=A0A182YP06_ANOST
MKPITLRIFNFPPIFTSVDVREFLHLFGLETDRFIKRRNTHGAIVSVDNESEVRLVIARLHQLQIKTHRLKVEYTANIVAELASNTALYYQTLHLMNKMNLKPPFESGPNADPIARVTERPEGDGLAAQTATLSDEESELESDSELNSAGKVKVASSLLKRTMKVVNYDPAPVEPQTVGKPQKKAKLEIHISAASLTASDGNIPPGDPTPVETPEKVASSAEARCPPPLSIDTILSNRIPDEQRKTLNVFQHYSAGEPTNKLYIKNLSKHVTEQDLLSVFGAFFPDKEVQTIDVRLMKTGRMKGQAFVTFVPPAGDGVETPDGGIFEACVERALTAVNGYILKDKPMVVSYAKKT